jgi:hypothetical protein
MSRPERNKFNKTSVEDAFFLDPTLVESLTKAGINTLGSLNQADPVQLARSYGIGTGRLEGVARMLRMVGLGGEGFFEEIARRKRGSVTEELIERYRAVGVTLNGELELREIREPGRSRYELEDYQTWMLDKRLTEWRKLVFRLAREGDRGKIQIARLISGVSGPILPATRRPEYLTLDLLRDQTPESLAGMGQRSKWRGLNTPQVANTLLRIFKE